MKKKLLISIVVFIMAMGFINVGQNFIKNKSIPPKASVNSLQIETKQKQDKLKKYNEYLDLQPLNNPESIINAQDKYFKLFSLSDSQEIRDAAFSDYYNFYTNVIDKLNQGLSEGGIDYSQQETKSKYYKKYGILLGGSEGMLYPEIDFKFLIKHFDKFLSPEWNEYLKYCLKKYEEHPFDDGGVSVRWDELRSNIIYQENFLKKYPHFSENDSITQSLDRYLSAYFGFLPNSPICESPILKSSDTSPIRQEVKHSYEKFIQENKNSKYYLKVFETYNVLKKHNFIVGKYYYKDNNQNAD